MCDRCGDEDDRPVCQVCRWHYDPEPSFESAIDRDRFCSLECEAEYGLWMKEAAVYRWIDD